MPVIYNFIDNETKTFATSQKISDATESGNYGGLTPLDQDGKTVPPPPISQISPDLINAVDNPALPRTSAVRFVQGAAPPNYLIWAAIAFGVWYFLIRKQK